MSVPQRIAPRPASRRHPRKAHRAALLAAAFAGALALPSCSLLPWTRPAPVPVPSPVAPVPADFRLEARCRDSRNPHCDYEIVVASDGTVAYDIRHRGARPSERRGATRLRDGGIRALWDSVNGGGIMALPGRIAPTAEGAEQGELTLRLRGGGKSATVILDHARHRATDHLLSVLYYYVPPEVFRAP